VNTRSLSVRDPWKKHLRTDFGLAEEAAAPRSNLWINQWMKICGQVFVVKKKAAEIPGAG